MQLSCRLPNADYLGFEACPDAIVQTATKAEALGFDAIFVNDHIIVDSSEARAAPWGNTYDPLVSLSFVAAHTQRIRLGTSVLIVPYRNAIATAKAIATLDQFSNGRMVVGVGTGWNESEFNALNVPFEQRGKRTDDTLAVWQACWGPDPVSFHSELTNFDAMLCSPKPVQQPSPPIWVGGASKPALRRAARFADVWQPVPQPLDALLKQKAYLADQCASIGRAQPPETRMSFRANFTSVTGANAKSKDGERKLGFGTPQQVAEDMANFAETAVIDAFQVNFNGTPELSQLHEQMSILVTEVKPVLDRLTA